MQKLTNVNDKRLAKTETGKQIITLSESGQMRWMIEASNLKNIQTYCYTHIIIINAPAK